MIKFDDRELRALAVKVEQLNEAAFPIAVRESLNDIAFDTRREYQKQIEEKLVTRNAFTKRSVRVDKVRSRRVSAMESEVGSIADYMERQETGGVAKPKEGSRKPIATAAASQEARGTRPRRKPVRARNRLSRIKLFTPKARTVVGKIKEAAAQGRSTFVAMSVNGRYGVYHIFAPDMDNIQLDMAYSLEKSSTLTPRQDLLGTALRKSSLRAPSIMKRRLQFQLSRKR